MADDAFQRRAGEEGRQVQAMARKVLNGCGFKDLRANERRAELGVTVNFIGHDATGREWYFDVSGAFTSKRAGLIRTDTMWKTLGRANVLHQAGIDRLVLLTTNLPKADSAGHFALTAAAPTFFDAIEMLTSEGKARLSLYAQGERDRPLPGLRAPAQLYSKVTSRTVGTDLQVRVPVVEVASAMPARVSADVSVMPHRLKVFLPSKNAAGTASAARNPRCCRRTDTRTPERLRRRLHADTRHWKLARSNRRGDVRRRHPRRVLRL